MKGRSGRLFSHIGVVLTAVSVLVLTTPAVTEQGAGSGTGDEATPPNPRQLSQLGRTAFDHGDYIGALIYLEEAIKGNPNDESTHFWMGRAFYELGEDEKAQSRLRKALVSSPKKPTYHYWLGRAQFGLGQFDQARRTLVESLKIDPKNPAAHTWLGMCYLSQAKENGESAKETRDKAVISLKSALELAPTFSSAHRWLAHAYRGLGRTDEALEHMAEAVRWAEWDWGIAFDMADLLASTGNDRGALVHFARAVSLHPDPESASYIYLALGKSSCRAGLYDPAIRAFKTAAELDPELLTETYLWLGRACHGKGDYMVSLELLDEFLKRKTNDTEGLYWSARSHFRRLNYDEASKRLKQVIRQAPGVGEYRHWMGRVAFWQGEYDLAEEQMRYATQIDPDHANSRWWLAEALLARGDLEGAAWEAYYLLDKIGDERGLAALRELHSFTPDGELVNRLLGILLFFKGDFREAIGYLTTASKAPVVYSATWTHLGWTHLALGELDQADVFFERALKSNAEDIFATQGSSFAALARGDAQRANEIKLRIPLERVKGDDVQMRYLIGSVWNLLKSGMQESVKDGHRFRGNLSSLGVVGSWRNGLRVLHVINATPAKRAKVRPGDRITEINMVPLTGWTVKQDKNKEFGAIAGGNTVLLTVWRDGRELGIVVDLANLGE